MTARLPILVACIALLASVSCGTRNSAPVPKVVTLAPALTPARVLHPPVSRKRPAQLSQPRPIHVSLDPHFRTFLNQICTALAHKDAGTVVNALPYFQYNDGLYYGTFNGGEGQTGSPDLIRQWVPHGNTHCVAFEPAIAGHAVVVSSGWPLDGGWNLIEFDIYGGKWKINDFTFGRQSQVLYALRSTSPEVLAYGPHGA